MTSPRLAVVIVNWNTGPLLARCLESIARHPPACPYEIVVVDNASTDDSLNRIAGMPDTILRNPDNQGFSQANNRGIRHTTAPFFLLLNPDTEVFESTLDRLLEAMDRDPKIAVAGSRLKLPDGSLQVSVQHNPPRAVTTLLDGLPLHRLIPQPWRGRWLLGRHWDHRTAREVPTVSGCSMLVRRAAAGEAGLLDETYHLYAEDDEWCHRFRRHGWKIWFVPDSVVLHHRHKSSLARWSADELAEQIVTSRLRHQFHASTRPAYVANLLATLAVYGPSLAARRLGLSRRTDTEFLTASWKLYLRELTERLRTGRWPASSP